jgi:hypothetical protein
MIWVRTTKSYKIYKYVGDRKNDQIVGKAFSIMLMADNNFLSNSKKYELMH